MDFSAADALSFSRIPLSLLMFLVEPLSAVFLTVYAVCGITDILDGYVARMTGKSTAYGRSLDSIADAWVAVVLLICLVPHFEWEIWMIWWISGIAAVRLVALGAGTGKFGTPAFMHTYLNKLAGVLLALTPFMLVLVDLLTTVVIVCSVATVSALEYLYINCSQKDFDPELKTVLVRH